MEKNKRIKIKRILDNLTISGGSFDYWLDQVITYKLLLFLKSRYYKVNSKGMFVFEKQNIVFIFSVRKIMVWFAGHS